jgi:hypothetical protein
MCNEMQLQWLAKVEEGCAQATVGMTVRGMHGGKIPTRSLVHIVQFVFGGTSAHSLSCVLAGRIASGVLEELDERCEGSALRNLAGGAVAGGAATPPEAHARVACNCAPGGIASGWHAAGGSRRPISGDSGAAADYSTADDDSRCGDRGWVRSRVYVAARLLRVRATAGCRDFVRQ